MIAFINRHFIPVLMAGIGLILVFVPSRWFESQQVGIGPDFIIKSFTTLWKLGVVWILSHVVVKYRFTTVYEYCRKGEKSESDFSRDWQAAVSSGGPCPELLRISVWVHIGAMIIAALVLQAV